MRLEDLERAAVRSLLEVGESLPRSKVNGKAKDAEFPMPDLGPTWPKALDEAAYHGIAGEMVRMIAPHSEADPAGLLVQFLIGFGNVIGRNAHCIVGADRHYPNLFAVLVDESGRGRKGSAWSAIRYVLRALDEKWDSTRVASGLSSGEGLIWGVRDQLEQQEPIRGKDKRVTGYQTVITDPGVTDKRLMVVEAEFSSPLKVMQREGNTLSGVVRDAWDTGMLRSLSKNSPGKATGAHISTLGHVTRNELLQYLTSTETCNGFGNRFLWVCVRRSKLLPEGGKLHTVDFGPILRSLDNAVRFARTAGELRRDDEARELWAEVYPRLTAERPGLLGAVTGRAEAIVLRLSLLYAVLDCCPAIRVPHLAAALEIWRYAEDSARFIFGDATGDPVMDAIMLALGQNPHQGMTRTDIYRMFDYHKSTNEIGRALTALKGFGKIRSEIDRETGGRPTERYFRA